MLPSFQSMFVWPLWERHLFLCFSSLSDKWILHSEQKHQEKKKTQKNPLLILFLCNNIQIIKNSRNRKHYARLYWPQWSKSRITNKSCDKFKIIFGGGTQDTTKRKISQHDQWLFIFKLRAYFKCVVRSDLESLAACKFKFLNDTHCSTWEFWEKNCNLRVDLFACKYVLTSKNELE